MFAMMFKWLPDTQVEWRDVWLGAAITAALFELGKLLIGIYVGRLALASTYGGFARDPADLGLLLFANRAARRGVHALLCEPLSRNWSGSRRGAQSPGVTKG